MRRLILLFGLVLLVSMVSLVVAGGNLNFYINGQGFEEDIFQEDVSNIDFMWPRQGIVDYNWIDDNTLFIETYITTFCGGATITDGSYELDENNLILKYRIVTGDAVTTCVSPRAVIYEISDIEKKDYDITIQEIQDTETTPICDKDNIGETYCKDGKTLMVCGVAMNMGTGEEAYAWVEERCEYGCKNKACLTPTYIEPEEDEEPLEVPEDIEEGLVYVCHGCILEEKCYPLGYRKESQYCSDEARFINQLKSDKSCDNSFECKSNVCVSGECVSEGLLKKILNWFRRLFGKG